MVASSLAAALAEPDLELALGLALVGWRETRSPAVADLIDRLTTRIAAPGPSRRGVFSLLWPAEAARYDPVQAGGLLAGKDHDLNAPRVDLVVLAGMVPDSPLLARVATHAYAERTEGRSAAVFHRLALMLAWPDDPRLATALATWLCHGVLQATLHIELADACYAAIADRLIELDDDRQRPGLASWPSEPRGPLPEIRWPQIERVLAAPPGPRTASAALEAVAATVPARDAHAAVLGPLWDEVVAHPDELGPRLVLADALTERGDPRGELITLHCQPVRPPKAETRLRRLVEQLYREGLGELSLAITRKGMELDRGLLVGVQLGLADTPPWLYAKLRDHPALRLVDRVRAHYLTGPQLATFLDGLEQPLRELRLSPAHLEAVAARGPSPATHLAYEAVRTSGYDRHAVPPLAEALRLLAAIAPGVEDLALRVAHAHPPIDELCAQVAPLWQGRLPRLRRIRLDPTHLHLTDEERAAVQQAGVELDAWAGR